MRDSVVPMFVLASLVACSDAKKSAPVETASSTAVVEASAVAAASAAAPAREAAAAPVEAVAPSAAPSSSAASARARALADAKELGMIGLLNAGGGDPSAAALLARDSLGAPSASARANMWGDAIGDSFGAGGLGRSGIGEGGGGRGEGIGLGNIGTIGHGAGLGEGQGYGSGSGRLAGSHGSKPPRIRFGAISVTGKLPPEIIQRIIRQNFGRFRLCYENGLKKTPDLAGTISPSFTIQSDGSVSDVGASGSLSDTDVVQCVKRGFAGLSFPQPDGGTVKVTIPLSFSPGDSVDGGGSGATSHATLGGKALADVRADDVRAALEKAGCTDVTRKENPPGVTSPTVFSAKKNGHTILVTFVAANDSPLAAADLSKLRDDGVVRQESGFVLAVQSDKDPDKSAARALLDALIVTT